MAYAQLTDKITTYVTLELTESEAQALRDVLDHVGGTPETTPRGDIDAIGEALTDAGFDRSGVKMSGSTYFESEARDGDDS